MTAEEYAELAAEWAAEAAEGAWWVSEVAAVEAALCAWEVANDC